MIYNLPDYIDRKPKTYTLTNIVRNGDLQFNTDDWTLTGITRNSNREFEYSASPTSTVIATSKVSVTPILGHKYYFRVWDKSEPGYTSEDPRCEWIYTDAVGADYVISRMRDTNGEWEMTSNIQTIIPYTGTVSSTWKFRHFAVKPTTKCWRKEMLIVDLSEAFGVGKEPGKAWCDKYIPYFNGKLVIAINPTVNSTWNFDYSGYTQNIVLPKGKYKLQVWGAQGGNLNSSGGTVSASGMGGYSYGDLELTDQSTKIMVYVGGKGTGSGSSGVRIAGGFNGGGSAYSDGTGEPGNSGGGGTDMRIGADSYYARIIVAGGGGGSGEDDEVGGAGGGLTGIGGNGSTSLTQASQTGPGQYSSFGYACDGSNGGGPGGGWYGGASNQNGGTSDNQGGCGGSGYVFTSSTASSYPSGKLVDNKYQLTNAATVAGNTSFVAPGGSNETGHSGNGYARITRIA